MSNTYSFHEFYIPPHMMDGLTRYIEHGIALGGFLTAVLENDLREACARADDINIRNLPAYACWRVHRACVGVDTLERGPIFQPGMDAPVPVATTREGQMK